MASFVPMWSYPMVFLSGPALARFRKARERIKSSGLFLLPVGRPSPLISIELGLL